MVVPDDLAVLLVAVINGDPLQVFDVEFLFHYDQRAEFLAREELETVLKQLSYLDNVAVHDFLEAFLEEPVLLLDRFVQVPVHVQIDVLEFVVGGDGDACAVFLKNVRGKDLLWAGDRHLPSNRRIGFRPRLPREQQM